jgi:GT2 family glycosyltransferase
MTHPDIPSLAVPVSARPAARPIGWRPGWAQAITDDGPVDISVCIANWNCCEYLRVCLESLHDLPQGVRVETIVADNGSSDGAVEMMARDFPEVVVIRNRENRGFARASNQAAAKARGKYILFLNNDTVVPAGTLKRLLDFAEGHPEAGMIGPKLRDADGRLQISFRKRPTIAALLHRTLLLRWTGLLKRAYYRYRRTGFGADGPARPVEVLMGAAVMMRRDYFEACGRWDEDFHFGGEDIELSARVGRERALMYVPGIEIVHHGRVSSRQNVAFAAPNVAIGYVHYFRKSGASRAAVFGYKLAVTLDAPLHLASKFVQSVWRSVRGETAKAEKSWIATRGVWHFLTKELVRFWKA